MRLYDFEAINLVNELLKVFF